MYSIKIKSNFGQYEVSFTETVEQILENISKDDIVIIDSNVYDLYKQFNLSKNLVIKFDCSESTKTLDGAIEILQKLIDNKVKSNANIFAVGGGILQDVVGFVCSIYCRGIKYSLVPTTLLSQCDSCIGGKTSINFESVKNILGSFYPPEKILICTKFTKTLTKKDLLSGFGEIIKFNILKNSIRDFNNLFNENDITGLVYESLRYKTSIIEIDEFDKKERKFLNFGHTFGHALESVSNYEIPHGTAVLLGILIANKISKHLNLIDESKEFELFSFIYNFISHQNLQEDWFDFNKLLDIVKLDKKNTGNINMVLLTQSGVVVNQIEDLNIIKQSTKEVYESIRLRSTISKR
jgi:3-dehydroquinate synthase